MKKKEKVNSMPSLTKKKIAYYASLTLLFSYVEMILPRTLPFFKLGLGNIALLMALDLSFSSFLLLSIIKALASSLMGGTLFSPFFLISLAQSLCSALIMHLLSSLNKKCRQKLISLYGISVTGSCVSAAAQISCCSLYLGRGTFALLGPILIFNCATGIITAFFSRRLSSLVKADGNFDFEKNLPEEKAGKESNQGEKGKISPRSQAFMALGILLAAASVFFIKSPYLLTAAMIASLAAQKCSGRKILLLPHVSLWIFIFISSILLPQGKILVKIWNISVTEGALLTALQKSLRLSAVSALSQCALFLKPPEKSILALSLSYYRNMSDRFRSSKGSIFQRVKEVISPQ